MRRGFSSQPPANAVIIKRSSSQPDPKCNLYISGVPSAWNKFDLEALFSPYGPLESTRVLVDLKTGISRGTGFVHFRKPQDAIKAIKGLDGSTPPGTQTTLTVRYAKADVTGGPVPSEFKTGGGPMQNVYVCGFPPRWRDAELEKLFSAFGDILKVKVITKAGSNGAAFVHFADPSGAKKAITAINGTTPPGLNAPISCRYVNQKPQNDKQTSLLEQSIMLQVKRQQPYFDQLAQYYGQAYAEQYKQAYIQQQKKIYLPHLVPEAAKAFSQPVQPTYQNYQQNQYNYAQQYQQPVSQQQHVSQGSRWGPPAQPNPQAQQHVPQTQQLPLKKN